MKYTDPKKQAIVDQAFANVQRAAHIMTAMQRSATMLRRREDKIQPVTAEQAARIAANKGKHIYGNSHPLYKESTNV